VTFKQEEAKDIQTVLEAYEDKLKAVSFLPISEHGYEQAPYESITKEKYEEMSSKIKEADYSKMTSALNALGSKFCDGESCEI
jgi:ribonucleoside-triphosphate reductase (thioredoxin)